MPEMVRVTVIGDKELIAKLRRTGEEGAKAARKALYQKAEEVAAKAKAPGMTPVKTGNLRSTIHVEPIQAGQSEYSIVAGGPAAPYALYVHEDLTARHPNGQAKYIERPFLEVLPTVAPAIGAALDKLLK